MARVEINSLKTSGDVAMAFNWEIRIEEVSHADVFFPSADTINIRCTNVVLPEPAVENIDLDVKNFRIPLVGRPLVKQEFTATFFDTISNEINTLFYDWNRAVSNPITGVQAPLEEVRTTVTVTRLDRQLNAIYKYEFIGAHLLNYKGLEGTSTGAVIAPQATWRFVTYKETDLV